MPHANEYAELEFGRDGTLQSAEWCVRTERQVEGGSAHETETCWHAVEAEELAHIKGSARRMIENLFALSGDSTLGLALKRDAFDCRFTLAWQERFL